MESVRVTARTVDEAVELGLKQLEIEREEAEVEVISRGRTGFLGFGAEQVRVQVTRLAEGAGLVRGAKQVVDRLLSGLGVIATSTIGKAPPDSPGISLIEIEGEDSGLLIGRRGETLRTLQFMVNLILGQQDLGEGRVILDVEQYKERRARSLRELALRMADRVASSGKPMALEPMPANERRVIHVTLAEHPRVVTASDGIGEARQVSILPRRSDLPQDERSQ